MKTLFAIVFASGLLAQTNLRVEVVQPTETTQIYRDASGNKEYICTANSVNKLSLWTRGGATLNLTSIAVSTNTATVTTAAAHGLRVGNLITVSGATVDTDLNGSYKIVTVGSDTTFTFTTASVADATYNEPPLRFSTTAPRLNDTVWSVQRLFYTGVELDKAQWAVSTSNVAGTKNFVCTDATATAALTYN